MITTVNRKGQVTIPKSLRDRYGFPPGGLVGRIRRLPGVGCQYEG